MGNGSFPITAFMRTPAGAPPSGDMDAYFDYWAAQGVTQVAASLRSSPSIASLSGSGPGYTYDPVENAMLCLWDKEAVNLPGGFGGGSTSPTIPLAETSGELLIVWHDKYESGWRPTANGGAFHARTTSYSHKEYQLYFGSSIGSGDHISWETRRRFTHSDGTKFPQIDDISLEYAVEDHRSYQARAGTDEPVGTLSNGPQYPAGRGVIYFDDGGATKNGFCLRYNEWQRHVLRVTLGVANTFFPEWEADNGVTLRADIPYHCVSQWVQNPRGIFRLIYKVPILTYDPGSSSLVTQGAKAKRFEWENNTSSHHPQCNAGKITITGTPGTVISNGQKFTYPTTGCIYENDDTGVVIGGGGSIEFNAISDPNTSNLGPAQNIPAGTVLTVTSPPAGCDPTATVTVDMTGGDWQFSRDLKFWSRDTFFAKDYTSAAWASDTPENDPNVFADMSAWA